LPNLPNIHNHALLCSCTSSQPCINKRPHLSATHGAFYLTLTSHVISAKPAIGAIRAELVSTNFRSPHAPLVEKRPTDRAIEMQGCAHLLVEIFVPVQGRCIDPTVMAHCELAWIPSAHLLVEIFVPLQGRCIDPTVMAHCELIWIPSVHQATTGLGMAPMSSNHEYLRCGERSDVLEASPRETEACQYRDGPHQQESALLPSRALPSRADPHKGARARGGCNVAGKFR